MVCPLRDLRYTWNLPYEARDKGEWSYIYVPHCCFYNMNPNLRKENILQVKTIFNNGFNFLSTIFLNNFITDTNRLKIQLVTDNVTCKVAYASYWSLYLHFSRNKDHLNFWSFCDPFAKYTMPIQKYYTHPECEKVYLCCELILFVKKNSSDMSQKTSWWPLCSTC